MIEKILPIHNNLLNLHIDTKTVCSQFHEKSADGYEFAFDLYHTVREKRVDLWLDKPEYEEKAYKQYYDYLMSIKIILENMVKEKNSVGMDNLLRGKLDELEWHIGNAKAFLSEENDEYEVKKENPLKSNS